MTRSVRAVALYHPIWEAEGRRVAGPDEDDFTLAVSALERLGTGPEAPSIERLWTIAASATASGPTFREALGLPNLEIGALNASRGLEEILSGTSLDPIAPGRFDAVAAADAEATSEGGAAAVAWLVGEGPGLQLKPEASTAENGPVVASRKAGLGGATGPGAQTPAATEAHTVGRRAASGNVALSIDLARRARDLAPGEEATWTGTEGRGRWRLSLTAPVRWAGPWASPTPSLPITPDRARRFREPVALGRVSEGAYLPRPRYLESLPSRWRLVAERCGQCGARSFPPRGRCRGCGSREALRADPLPLDDGEVEAVTTVRTGAQPTEFDPQVERFGDYDVAIVRLATDVRATFQVSDAAPGALRVGDRVGTALRRLYPQEGEWRYGRKAVPKGRPAAPTPPS